MTKSSTKPAKVKAEHEPKAEKPKEDVKKPEPVESIRPRHWDFE